MALSDTLTRISAAFNRLGAGGEISRELRQATFEELAGQFEQLKLDLAATPGWQQATGTATRTTFDTATVTLPLLAQRMKALIDDFFSRGTLSA